MLYRHTKILSVINIVYLIRCHYFDSQCTYFSQTTAISTTMLQIDSRYLSFSHSQCFNDYRSLGRDLPATSPAPSLKEEKDKSKAGCRGVDFRGGQRANAHDFAHMYTRAFARYIQEKESERERQRKREWETRMMRKRETRRGRRGWRSERKGEVGGIAVYLYASRYNTSELMPPTHRHHLRGLSYGGYFWSCNNP